MSSRVPAKKEKSATKPLQKMQGHTGGVTGVLRLPDNRQIITCSLDGTLRVWDLESGMQVGKAWMDEGIGYVLAIALSPDGKTVASGGEDGTVRLWEIDTGKVIKRLTGHTKQVLSVCWSPDGGRVVSGCGGGTFIVWGVKSGKVIRGPIEAVKDGWVWAVCYSPDSTMIATGTELKVWDANTGQLLKTLEGVVFCLTWISEGKTLIARSYCDIAGTPDYQIRKFDTSTWTETAVLEGHDLSVAAISLSPNERILASVSSDNTARLWNLETNQPIGQPFYHEDEVMCATFSVDGRFLVTGCDDNDIYKWDVSDVVKEAGLDHLLSDNVKTVKKQFNINADATRPRPSKIEGTRPSRRPPGFFDDFSTSRGRNATTPPNQRTFLSRLPSFMRRRSNSRGATEHDTPSRSHPRSWAKNLMASRQRRQDGSNIQLRELPVVDVPCAPGLPRNYHARGKKAASYSRPPNISVMQQPPGGATQSTPPPSSSQQATTSAAIPAVSTTAAATGTSHVDITIRGAGCWTRFWLWIGCISVENNQP